jgi:hypothetical protein
MQVAIAVVRVPIRLAMLHLLLVLSALLGVLSTGIAAPANAVEFGKSSPILQVGPRRTIKTLAEASRRVQDGTLVEVDAGNYIGDTAVWRNSDLHLLAIGGRVRLIANGSAAEGKGIWVVRAQRMTVEGFDFEGAVVPDRNGAGIRFERGSLLVRDCIFRGNQSGILAGNDRSAVLEVEDSEFVSLLKEDGRNHHLYAGMIGRLSVTGSYFHRGNLGHLLKSRAALNMIRYNRLSDEDGSASYELEFPNGGLAIVVANIIQQSPSSENPHIIAYGAEGYLWPVNELHLVNNTVVDDKAGAGGVLIRVQPGADRVRALNNLWVSGRRPAVFDASADFQNNFIVDRADIDTSPVGGYRLRPSSRAWARAIPPGDAHGLDLTAMREFHFPRGSVGLTMLPTNPGALQSRAAAVAR